MQFFLPFRNKYKAENIIAIIKNLHNVHEINVNMINKAGAKLIDSNDFPLLAEKIMMKLLRCLLIYQQLNQSAFCFI